ncbi:MAG: hypothetical protein H7Y02_10680 [Candidatus Obscuribacterales bacterium]|nr:hypothetical protein [Steroidobacteraceae bacterium]
MPDPQPKKKPKSPTPPRLYVILARESPMAVIFRRGPSKQVLTLSWDTVRHEFRFGQWFKGRIYERRCDLSPSGEKLIYFAANQKKPYYTWTAVSRPPFLTALALWPKGDAWGGGGLFKNDRTILLNHSAYQTKLADEFQLPTYIVQEQLIPGAGGGEDEPILQTRLKRDGWQLEQPGTVQENKFGSELWLQYPMNQVWTKARGKWAIEMRVLGLKERDGAWYVIEHNIVDANGEVVLTLGRSDWADWSQTGEVLLATQGRLFRIVINPKSGPGEPEELINLCDLKFQEVAPPSEAMQWEGKCKAETRIR